MYYKKKYYKPSHSTKKYNLIKPQIRASNPQQLKTNSIVDWNTYLIKIRNEQLPTLDSVYEAFTLHGITCKCCTLVPRGEDTCPLKEQQLVQHTRGRPSAHRRWGYEE